MATLHYDKVADVLDKFKALLDAAERGRPATLRRDKQTAALVDADRLRYFLGTTAPNANATVVAEADSWWVFTKGLSISADGATLDEALDGMVAALREYAEDWQDHLFTASNHADNWGLVQLVGLSSDAQLREWLGVKPDRGAPEPPKDSIPVEVASLLIHRVGLSEPDVAELTREDAIARLNEYWATQA